eukprot:gene10649-12329_t
MGDSHDEEHVVPQFQNGKRRHAGLDDTGRPHSEDSEDDSDDDKKPGEGGSGGDKAARQLKR